MTKKNTAEQRYIKTLVSHFGDFYSQIIINQKYSSKLGDGEIDVLGILGNGEKHIYEVKSTRGRNNCNLKKANSQLIRAGQHYNTPYCAVYIGKENVVIPMLIASQ